MYKIIRLLLIFSSVCLLFSQSSEEMKRFMELYGNSNIDQSIKDNSKIDADKFDESKNSPVKVLIDPSDISDYYYQRIDDIKKELKMLSNMISYGDSIKPISYFGYDYFTKRDSIQLLDNSIIPSNYKLGYGDEVIFSVWGQAEQYQKIILNRDGTVFLDNVGLLYLGGLTVDEAEEYSKNRFSKVYATISSSPPLTFFDFSIGKVKNINISVIGKVEYPGNYVVNPNIGLHNILFLAGGIKEIGSLRNIKIQRNNKIFKSIDLYPLITGEGNNVSTNLLDGDIIIIPTRKNSIPITGAILNPAYFEIKSNESISKIINYAGGFSNNGSKNLMIVGVNGNTVIDQGNLDEFKISIGDSIIAPYRQKNINTISVSTDFVSNQTFPWIENMTVRNIIKILNIDSNSLKNIEISSRINNSANFSTQIVSPPFDEIVIHPFDHLMFHYLPEISLLRYVNISGEIPFPGDYPLLNSNENLNSLLNRSGGILSSSSKNHVLIKRDSLFFGSESGEISLMPNDSIIVNKKPGSILVEGAVNNPGLFAWEEGAYAKYYIKMAGGINSYGDKKNMIYITPYGRGYKISRFKNPKLLDGGKIVVSEKPISQLSNQIDRVQQFSGIITSLVTIAILANSTSN